MIITFIRFEGIENRNPFNNVKNKEFFKCTFENGFKLIENNWFMLFPIIVRSQT